MRLWRYFLAIRRGTFQYGDPHFAHRTGGVVSRATQVPPHRSQRHSRAWIFFVAIT